MIQRHDKIFKVFCSFPELLQQIVLLIEIWFPDEVARKICWKTPAKLVNIELIDESLRALLPDTIVELTLIDGGKLHIVIEFSSYLDRKTVWKVFRYRTQVMALNEASGHYSGMFPQTYAFIVYIGEKPFPYPLEVGRYMTGGDFSGRLGHVDGIIDVRNTDWELYAANFPPGLRLLLYSVRARPSEIAMIATAMQELGINHGFTTRIFAYLKGDESFAMEKLFDILGINMTDFVSSYEETLVKPWLDQGETIGIAKGEKIGIAKGEKIGIAKGEKIGIAKGEKIGKAKGEKIGKAKVLVRLLVTRFGEVPEELRNRVHEASEKTLDSWLVSILDAKDIKSVFRRRQNS